MKKNKFLLLAYLVTTFTGASLNAGEQLPRDGYYDGPPMPYQFKGRMGEPMPMRPMPAGEPMPMPMPREGMAMPSMPMDNAHREIINRLNRIEAMLSKILKIEEERERNRQ